MLRAVVGMLRPCWDEAFSETGAIPSGVGEVGVEGSSNTDWALHVVGDYLLEEKLKPVEYY